MTADAGLAAIDAEFRARAGLNVRPGLEVSPPPHTGDPVDRLVAALSGVERELAAARKASLHWWPNELPVINYTVAGGVPKLAIQMGGVAESGPRTGYFWDITRVSIDGLAAGDTVTAYKTSSGIAAGVKRVHTFSVSASPGPDWEVSGRACMMRQGDALLLSGSGLTATALIMSGEMVVIEAPFIGEYLK